MPTILRIADWDDLYENSRTREMKRMQWVPVPCKFGDGYTELLTEHKNGPGHYAAWMAFLLTAGRSETRGTLFKNAGRPHDTASISSLTKVPKHLLDEALPRLVAMGWIVTETIDEPQVNCGQTAVKPQVNCGEPAGTRARPRPSLPFLSIPFFLGKGVQGERGELPEILDSDDFRQTLDDWIAYKNERREGYKPTGLRQMLTHAANMAKQHGLQAIVGAMTKAMANSWKGWDQDSIFKPNEGGRSGKSSSNHVGAGQRFQQ